MELHVTHVCRILFARLLPVLLLASLASRAALASGEIAVQPERISPGQTVTLRWYFTGDKVLVAGGRFGKGTLVTGKTAVTDRPTRTTRYTFDVWYHALVPAPRGVSEVLRVHNRYIVTVLVAAGATPSRESAAPSEREPSLESRMPGETLIRQVVELTNAERARHHLPPLKLENHLCSAAQWMAQDLADHDYFGHQDRQGRNIDGRLPDFGYTDYSEIGENIAGGQPTPAEVVQGWMNSPGHRANILNPEFREIGIGYVESRAGRYRHYWVQDFGTRFDVFPLVINGEAAQTHSAAVSLYIHSKGDAEQMRLSNDGEHWSSWEPYRAQRDWALEAGNGTRTVYVEVRNGVEIQRARASIELAPAVAL